MSAPVRVINRYRIYRRVGYGRVVALRLAWDVRDWLWGAREPSRL